MREKMYFLAVVSIVYCLLQPHSLYAQNSFFETSIVTSESDIKDHFGHAVAISEEYAVVGSPNQEAVYIYKKMPGNPAGWEVEKVIKFPNVDSFGYSVAISGSLVLVGAPFHNENGPGSGTAYLFGKDKGGIGHWGPITEFHAEDGDALDFFGFSVAISGNTVMIGAYNDSNEQGIRAGAVYVFQQINNNPYMWSSSGKLIHPDVDAYDYFGYSVAISDGRAVVGAIGDDEKGGSAGAAYVFKKNHNGVWTTNGIKLTAYDGAVNDQYGTSVDIHDDMIIVGSPGDDGKNDFDQINQLRGTAYIYGLSNNNEWNIEKHLEPEGAGDEDQFGFSVAISERNAVVGSIGSAKKGKNSGAAHIFIRTNAWKEMQLLASDGNQDDNYGTSVAINGDHVLIGADHYSDDVEPRGSAYFYEACYAPRITLAPVFQATCVNQDIQFEVVAEGTELDYQWEKDGLALVDTPGKISGVNTPLLTIHQADEADIGSFRCYVTGKCGEVFSNTADLFVDGEIPSIVKVSEDQSVCQWSSVNIAVQATGNNISYQWLKDGNKIPGITGDTLFFDEVLLQDEGSYTCLITNDCGLMVTSEPIMLSVSPAPTVSNVSESLVTRGKGESVSLAISTLENPDEVSCLWYKNGYLIDDIEDKIAGTHTHVLTIKNLSAEDEGFYSCKVIGDECYTFSDPIEFKIGFPTAVEEDEPAVTAIALYPNPNQGQFTIILDAVQGHEIRILDVFGRELLRQSANYTGAVHIRLPKPYQKGIYYARVKTDKGVFVKKFLVK